MIKINGDARVLVIAADPVIQVKAPELFNRVFAHFGVNAVMVPLHVSAVMLAPTLTALLGSRSIAGISLSIPHKSAAISLCSSLSPLAAQAGAVNALRLSADATIEGALFDGVGLARALEHAGFSYRGKRVLVIGAGGAAAAIIASLRSEAALIGVFDTDHDKALALAQRFSGNSHCELSAALENDPQGYDLVINASPLGLRDTDPLPADPARMSSTCQVYDIVMRSPATRWVNEAKRLGLVASNGFSMLTRQLPDYLKFFGFGEIAAAVEQDDTLFTLD